MYTADQQERHRRLHELVERTEAIDRARRERLRLALQVVQFTGRASAGPCSACRVEDSIELHNLRCALFGERSYTCEVVQ